MFRPNTTKPNFKFYTRCSLYVFVLLGVSLFTSVSVVNSNALQASHVMLAMLLGSDEARRHEVRHEHLRRACITLFITPILPVNQGLQTALQLN